MSMLSGKCFLPKLQVCGEETEIYFMSEECIPRFALMVHTSPVFGKHESKHKKVVHSMIIFVKRWNCG